MKGVADPLDEVAKRIAKKYRLICSMNSTLRHRDAMILYNLLSACRQRRILHHDLELRSRLLYPDGLHRDRMLRPLRCSRPSGRVNVDAGVDYRGRALEQVDSYYTPWAATDKAARRVCAHRRNG